MKIKTFANIDEKNLDAFKAYQLNNGQMLKIKGGDEDTPPPIEHDPIKK